MQLLLLLSLKVCFYLPTSAVLCSVFRQNFQAFNAPIFSSLLFRFLPLRCSLKLTEQSSGRLPGSLKHTMHCNLTGNPYSRLGPNMDYLLPTLPHGDPEGPAILPEAQQVWSAETATLGSRHEYCSYSVIWLPWKCQNNVTLDQAGRDQRILSGWRILLFIFSIIVILFTASKLYYVFNIKISLMVAGLTPYKIIGYFNWRNPFCHTMSLWST